MRSAFKALLPPTVLDDREVDGSVHTCSEIWTLCLPNTVLDAVFLLCECCGPPGDTCIWFDLHSLCGRVWPAWIEVVGAGFGAGGASGCEPAGGAGGLRGGGWGGVRRCNLSWFVRQPCAPLPTRRGSGFGPVYALGHPLMAVIARLLGRG